MFKKLFFLSIIFVLTLNLPAQEFSGDRDHVVSYFSSALGEDADCRIYLPRGYDPSDTDTRYPVVYLLHGAGAGFEMFNYLLPVVDGFWSTAYIEPFIMVMPDGTRDPFKGSFYTNSTLYGNFEDIIYQDLIPFIDSNYNTLAQKSFRGLWGFSMGAYGAFKQAFKHSEYYVAVAAHSGPVNFDLLDNLIQDVKDEQGGQPPFDWKYESGKGVTSLMISMAGAFSPNPESENLVDFPLDQQGEMIPEVLERWKPHNIAQLASDLPTHFDMPIYFDCGILDEYKLIHHNRSLSDTLSKYNIQHDFREYLGDHTSGLVFRLPVALKFLDKAFASVINGTEQIHSEKIDEVYAYPNPASGPFRIRWQSESESEAEITIIDVLGREAFTGQIYSGEALEVESVSLPPGMYFITISNPQINLNSRIIIK